MQINLIAVGDRMPEWVKSSYQEYSKRLPADYRLHLIEIPAPKRTKSMAIKHIVAEEGVKLLGAAEPSCPLIALDRKGRSFSTEDLAKKIANWHDVYPYINLLVGGPEGLSNACIDQAQEIWSLSALTFPHPLVRVILAEQIYRAWSILAHHPYHRSA